MQDESYINLIRRQMISFMLNFQSDILWNARNNHMMVTRRKQIDGSIRQTCLHLAKNEFSNIKKKPYGVCMFLQKKNNIIPETLPKK